MRGIGACKDRFHSVHIVLKTVEIFRVKRMDAVERGYDPQGGFMARLIQQLTEAKIRTLTKIGLYHDGAGLYLQIRPGGARSWIYRFRLNRRARDMGLGALADVSLVKARDKAGAARALVNDGIDPIEHTRAQTSIPAAPKRASSPSFEEVAEAYMTDRLKRLRSEIHRRQWRQSLLDYVYPIIGAMPVNEIETNDVLAVLRPIWETKCETATRIRERIERILARATVEGLRRGANPATWRGHLQEALPARSEVQPVERFRAMEFRDVRVLMAQLCQIKTVGAMALRFLIFCAARSGEVLGARWGEIDWTENTWTIPAARTKTNRAHIVPLSTGALAALREIKPLHGMCEDFIFPGTKGAGVSGTTLLVLLQRRMNRAATTHGFRSAFRDWCGDEGEVPRELAEAALAHAVKDATEQAYRRKTAVERRRKVMQAWCDYISPPVSTEIVDIQEARRARAIVA
jgi:integrase